MKFKVGDKVRMIPSKIKDFRVDNDEFKDGIVEGMVEIVNQCSIFTVYEVYDDTQVYFEEDDADWIWDVTWFEKVENKRIEPIRDEIKLQYCGRSTIAMHDGKVGMTFRSYDDNEDRKVGILIATMRAIGFKKEIVNKVVDVLFDDLKEIDKCTTEDLLKEIINRVK